MNYRELLTLYFEEANRDGTADIEMYNSQFRKLGLCGTARIRMAMIKEFPIVRFENYWTLNIDDDGSISANKEFYATIKDEDGISEVDGAVLVSFNKNYKLDDIDWFIN